MTLTPIRWSVRLNTPCKISRATPQNSYIFYYARKMVDALLIATSCRCCAHLIKRMVVSLSFELVTHSHRFQEIRVNTSACQASDQTLLSRRRFESKLHLNKFAKSRGIVIPQCPEKGTRPQHTFERATNSKTQAWWDLLLAGWCEYFVILSLLSISQTL